MNILDELKIECEYDAVDAMYKLHVAGEHEKVALVLPAWHKHIEEITEGGRHIILI